MITAEAVTELSHKHLTDALKGGLAYLDMNYRLLDNLNVFPVPDGDTGVNMLLTIKPSVEQLLGRESLSGDELFIRFNEAVTANSRGNSGFILSRFFNGFSKPILMSGTIDAATFTKAFESGCYEAKASLMNPVEGTMITIISAVAARLQDSDESDITALLRMAVEAADEALFQTPELLPTLARAGVVDSGALGFIFILRGMLCGISGERSTLEDEGRYRFQPDTSIKEETDIVKFRYCTELMAGNVTDFCIESFKEFLKEEGDSIAVLYEKDVLKLHIHTNNPELIISKVERCGEIIKTKVEDMEEQIVHRGASAEVDDFAVLSLVPGDGFTEFLSELGCGEFLLYDELPSVKTIADRLRGIDCDNIILFPNDKNIIPAALKAGEDSGRNVAVILTQNIVQGISALYGYNELENFSTNIKLMNDNMELALSIKANISAMEVQYGDVLIRENDFFISQGDDVLSTGETFAPVLLEALESFDMSDRANLTFFYNDTVDPQLIEESFSELRKAYPVLEFDLIYGGQKKSAIIIAVE